MSLISNIDADLYRAAAKGEIDVFRGKTVHQILHLLTPNRNTVLHIHVTASTTGQTDFVNEILKLCPALLLQPNAEGEIPLHMAARYGHDQIVEDLIKYVKSDCDIESGQTAAWEMLRKTNERNDTSLHEAVRFNHRGVAKILIEEDPDFSYGTNKFEETPLYIAAERGCLYLLHLMVDKCSSPAFGGPCGRTALHAAVIKKNITMTTKILEKMGHLTKQADHRGWVPLHFAVHLNYFAMVKDALLRQEHKDAAYMRDLKGRTPLHIAASHGYHEMMTEILSCCPDCGELVDDRGWNALNFAAKSNKSSAVKVILNDSSLSNLLNGRDNDGNTPLHIAASLFHTKFRRALDFVSRVDRMAYNNKNQNSTDTMIAGSKTFGGIELSSIKEFAAKQLGGRVLIYQDEEDLKEFEEDDFDIDKARDSNIIVAILIATITFAAGFTLPGGYVSEKGPLQGTAMLRQNAAFQAFLVTDTIALMLSTLTVLILISLYSFVKYRNVKLMLLIASNWLINFAMAAMVIAFVTGTYAVLAPSSALAVATCVTGLSFLVLFCVISYFNIPNLR